jgi:polyphosphate kinase 2
MGEWMSGENGDGKYKHRLEAMQIELVKLQRKWIEDGARVLIIVEGRDGAGKDGTIKRIVEHMSPRETRIFAPSKPSDREKTEWYFQRFVPHLPSGGECAIFNRSWYNRAGVERVMGFCTGTEVESFFDTVDDFEALLVRSGLAIRKYYLDITRSEQKKRLAERQKNPLKAWKNSPVDAQAIRKWNAYTEARDEMFHRSSHELAPWRVVRADHKKEARLAVIRDILISFDYPGKKKSLIAHDHRIVFPWSQDAVKDGRLAK